MGVLEKIMSEELKEIVIQGCVKLKEAVIQGYDKDIRTVITQYEQTYDGKSLYKVFVITKYDGELFYVVQSCKTDNRKKSDKIFSDFEKKYRGSSITRKIF